VLAPIVGTEHGGASPGGEPAAHLEDAGGRGAGRHQPHLEAAPDFGCDETSARVARREGRGEV
jgi:hypothetical protein